MPRVLIESRNGTATLSWLRRSPGAKALASIARGATPLSHVALDELGEHRCVRYLRGVVVEAGAIPAQNETLRRLEVRAEGLVALAGFGSGSILGQYTNRNVLRRCRSLAQRQRLTQGSSANAISKVAGVTRFLVWLASTGTTLANAHQANIDEYLALHTNRALPEFLHWAQRNGYCSSLHAPTHQSAAPNVRYSGEEREALIETLLTHPTSRSQCAAGLLVLTFGCSLTRVLALREEDVRESDGEISILIGTRPMPIPGRMAPLYRELANEARQRPRGASVGAQRWLFAGMIPGQHLSSVSVSKCLGPLGFNAVDARNSARLELSKLGLPVVAADAIGVSPDTMAKWSQLSGATFQAYPALRHDRSE